MPPINIILNGTFDAGSANWSGTDLETSFPESAYLGNGSSNRVAETDGNRNATTVMEQTFTIDNALTTSLTLDVALRNASLGNAGVEGFIVEVLDSSGTAIASLTILPTANSFQPFSLPVSFPAAGDYTLRFTEVGPDDSLGAIVDNIEILVCFAQDTRIETPDGPVLVQDLRVGDMVQTLRGPKRLRWIGRRRLVQSDLAKNDRFRPVRITAGALGRDLPSADLLVSRQHRMMIDSPVAKRMFGAANVLVSAIRLTELPGIFIDEDVDELTYFHLLFDDHQVVFANDAPSESLHTGQEALRALSGDALEELVALFPDLFDEAATTAFLIPSRKRQRRFVNRLRKNSHKPLHGDRAGLSISQ
ncbi:Hint domain-containing protein [Yoonia sp. GPGPB17]|uniref:Hint domain-containing protein n=1 Tax=Yoonia sp. GPGPB17 TaxID=3026147 RepID=UPI0030C38C3A